LILTNLINAVGYQTLSRFFGAQLSLKSYNVCTPDNFFENDLLAYRTLASGNIGYTPGNPFSLKCWDKSLGLEFQNFEIIFENPYGNAYIGEVFPEGDDEYSIVNIEFVTTTTQSYSLTSGYQFVSTRVIPDNQDMQNILEEILGNLDFVRDSEGHMLRKIGPNWINSIGNWVTTEGYLFKMINPDSFEIIGYPIFEQTPIELINGYQIISYLPSDPRDCEEVFTGILNNLDFVRNTAGQMFRKIGSVWVNGIGDMQPGEGYLVKMNNADELIYSTFNHPPESPNSPIPENGAINQSIEVDISWTCTDPDGDPITYDVYFGIEATPPQITTGQTETTYDPGTLENNTEYFWKIVAYDDHSNTTEGSEWSFTTEAYLWQCSDPFTDLCNGQTYNTVLIGEQCWLKENLNVGSMINGYKSMSDDGVIEKYCYDNEPANCETYGGLYQWNEIMEYSNTPGAQGICPAGWHIPTDDEWKTLEGTVDSLYPVGDPEWEDTGSRGYDAGEKLKFTSGWNQGGNGTNDFGFTALPGGGRYSFGNFSNLTILVGFWSSIEFNSLTARCRFLRYDSDEVKSLICTKRIGKSVRCLQD